MTASRAQRATTAERRTRAIAMKLAGATYDQIASTLGYASKGAACQDIKRALEHRLEEQGYQADLLKQQELARLDRLQAGHWAGAIGGDTRAAEVVMKVIAMRIKLLGLDAPARVEVVTYDAVEAEMERLARLMAQDINPLAIEGP